jgi:putative molybdopterin biosynthesis protein
MGPAKEFVISRLRAARKAKGLSQAELAERVGVKRQAIYDMESGRYLPGTAVALRLARILGCRVEDLFSVEEPGEEKAVCAAESPELYQCRVSVTKVRDRLVAHPLDGRWMLNEGFQAADGLMGIGDGKVRLLQSERELAGEILLLGCDPAFSILSAHLARAGRDLRLRCRFASSRRALESLAKGHAHIAGTHLHNPGPEESNVAMARQVLGQAELIVVAFSFFEEGLMVAAGNPLAIRGVADLARQDVRIVNREIGAALRVLLDDCLTRFGITPDLISGYDAVVSSHAEGAQMVRYRLADAALGLRAVAVAHGLDFVPIEAVRCDLVIPNDLMDHPAVRAVLDVLQTRSLRTELASLPGYESTCTGSVISRDS